jgi:hypothetical protein
MRRRLTARDNLPVLLVILATHAIDIAVALIYGQFEILWLELVAGLVHGVLLLLVFRAGRATSEAGGSR